MKSSASKSSTAERQGRSAHTGERPPALGLPGVALPQVAPPPELVALQRLIASWTASRPIGGPITVADARIQLATRDRPPQSLFSRDGAGNAGGRELTELSAETRAQALTMAQTRIKQAFGSYVSSHPKLAPSLADDEEKNIEYQSDRDFENDIPLTPEEQASGNRSRSVCGTYAYALGRTPLIRVRASLTDNPHLVLILTHELIHTLAKWSEPPTDLEESATQLLAIHAQDPSQPLTEARIDQSFVYVTQTNNLNDILSQIAGEQKVPLLAAAYLQNNSAPIDARINARLSPGTEDGRYIFLAAFSRTWPRDFDGRSVPAREARLSQEDPIATLLGLLEGSRQLVKHPRTNALTIRRSVPQASPRPAAGRAGQER